MGEKPGSLEDGSHRDEVASPAVVTAGPRRGTRVREKCSAWCSDVNPADASREPIWTNGPLSETPARALTRHIGKTGPVSAPPELPDIVTRAFDVSRRAGYVSFCRNETGRLLATLAATRSGTMAEFGTGCGVGTAWLRSGVRGAAAQIVSAELDEHLAKEASEIFADDAQVEVIAADWAILRDRGPFALLFLDAETPGGVSPTSSPTWSRRVASSSSTTSSPPTCGRRSSTDASTACASPGSPTSVSPPSRSWSPPTPAS